MSTQNITTNSLLNQENTKKKFEELLGERSSAFLTSVLQVTASNDLLSKADPFSVYGAAMLAATLNLPINNQLGFAYIVPFNNRKANKIEAQFQLGYKGYIQLSMRSGQFKTISATPIYEGQLVSENPLTGYEFDFSVGKIGQPIGYAAYFKLLSGFEKMVYMSKDELKNHGLKFSQTFKKGYGLWQDDFDSMATKTVIKLLLSKYAPLSIDMQNAIHADSSVIKDAETLEVEYVDNNQEERLTIAQNDINVESERILDYINNCKSLEDLGQAKQHLSTHPNLTESYNNRLKYLANGKE